MVKQKTEWIRCARAVSNTIFLARLKGLVLLKDVLLSFAKPFIKMFTFRAHFFSQGQAIAVLGLLLIASAHAATYYVDSSVSSSGNGQSWTTAWKNLSNINGLSPGDTVYISGGPSGSSQTYSVSGWTPAGGSASAPITYQIGQDSAHNGNAIFSGSGNFFGGAPNYVVFSGQANDTAQHFTLSNYNGIIGGASYFTVKNFRFAYVSATLNVTYNCFWFYGSSGIEIDHNYLNAVSGSGGNGGNDVFCQLSVTAGGTWNAGAKVHDNTVLIPRISGGQNGYDFIQCDGSGISVYSNVVMAIIGNYSGGQHGDGVQSLGNSSYLKVCNNVISNMPSSAVFLDCYGGNITYTYVYNNIIWLPGNNDFGIFGGPDSGGPTTGTLNNCVVANNVFAGPGAGSITMEWAGPGQGVAFTPGQFFICNNVFYNGGTPSYSFNSGGQQVTADNPTGVSSSDFVNASAGNFHLTSKATDLIGKGTNLSSFFTIDADSNSRQGLPTAWDIGAYAYGVTNSATNIPPVNSPIIGLSTNILNFGFEPANSTSNLTIVIKNAGGGSLVGTASISSPFSIVSGGSYNLASNATQIVTVGYAPTAAASDSQTIYFTNTNGGEATATAEGLSYVIQPSLSFSSTNGTIIAPFAATGNYVSQATDTSAAGVAGGGQAIYGFTINTSGSYYVTANVLAPSDGQNSLFVSIDTPPTDPTNIWDCVITTNFLNEVVSLRGGGNDTNDQFSPMAFNLTAGVHQLIIVGREAGTEIGAISILPVGSASTPPTGVAIVPTPPTFGIRLITNEPGVTNTVEASWSGVNSGGVSISWGDGNNTTSTQTVGIQDYKYNTSGNYTIGFTYTGANGSVLTTNQLITAY